MKKTLLAFSLAILLAACVTTTTTDSSQSPLPEPTSLDANWTTSLSSQKMALRSCILADKNIQAILSVEQQSKATTLVVQEKNGAVLNCIVDTKSNKVIALDPINKDVSTRIKFYPVGKKSPATCSNKESIMDAEGRLMGIVCS